MIAHVGGFGLANSSLKHQKILQKSICIYWARGSIGYIPPGIIVNLVIQILNHALFTYQSSSE